MTIHPFRYHGIGNGYGVDGLVISFTCVGGAKIDLPLDDFLVVVAAATAVVGGGCGDNNAMRVFFGGQIR